MRILRFSSYIFKPDYKEHCKNTTGYGRSVWDICRYSSMNGNEEYLYTHNNNNEINEANVKILQCMSNVILRHIDFKTFYKLLKIIKIIPKLKDESIKSKLAT